MNKKILNLILTSIITSNSIIAMELDEPQEESSSYAPPHYTLYADSADVQTTVVFTGKNADINNFIIHLDEFAKSHKCQLKAGSIESEYAHDMDKEIRNSLWEILKEDNPEAAEDCDFGKVRKIDFTKLSQTDYRLFAKEILNLMQIGYLKNLKEIRFSSIDTNAFELALHNCVLDGIKKEKLPNVTLLDFAISLSSDHTTISGEKFNKIIVNLTEVLTAKNNRLQIIIFDGHTSLLRHDQLDILVNAMKTKLNTLNESENIAMRLDVSLLDKSYRQLIRNGTNTLLIRDR